MLPLYPNFKSLEIEDKNSIEEITDKFPPYSDFNFVSLYSYDVESDAHFSILNNNLVIKFRDYLTNEFFYSFIGGSNVVETTRELLERSTREGFAEELKLIPESVINSNTNLKEQFLVKEDPDNFDYVLELELISNLEGNIFGSKRNLVNRFNKENPDFKILNINLQNEENQNEIIKMFGIWLEVRGKSEEEANHELTAIKRFLSAEDKSRLVCIGLYIEDDIAGFAAAELLNNDFSIFHFVKGNTRYKGIFEVLYNSIAKELMKHNRKYFNIEQDLGIPGLRVSKEQWNPAFYLKKYTIKRKIS